MNNHGLANTCKVHAHASCWDVAHLLPDTGTIGSILAPVGVCCDTRQRRVFVSSICPSGVLLPYGVAFLLQSRLTTQLWLEQHWRRVSSVASCFIGRMDTRSSHQSPTRDDSQDTGKCSLLHDVDASRLRSLEAAAVMSIHVSLIVSFAYLVTDSSAQSDYAVLFPPTPHVP
ncbi:hypothetical protein EDD17DRAFT_1061917 [Pisolithus thermaeus]|nr:hypothetical protein EDD17DRAFT_1061917 [Pisolithus thermaeus]